MNTALWAVQIILALIFLMAGFLKATKPYETLKTRMAWVDDFSPGIVRLIGILEALAAIGLILPALTGILPILTPLAAAGLALTMIGAIIVHIRRGEMLLLIPNIVLLAAALFVAYGRFVAVPL